MNFPKPEIGSVKLKQAKERETSSDETMNKWAESPSGGSGPRTSSLGFYIKQKPLEVILGFILLQTGIVHVHYGHAEWSWTCNRPSSDMKQEIDAALAIPKKS